MMALLGAEYFEILEGYYSFSYLYCETSVKTSSIKLVIAISNDYLSGVSSSAVTIESGYVKIFVGYDINGLTGFAVDTSDSGVIGSNTSSGITYNTLTKRLCFSEGYLSYIWYYLSSGYKVFVFY